MYGKSNMETYITTCKIDSQGEFALWFRGSASTDEWIKKLWYMDTMEYYSAIKRNAFESGLMRWVNLEPITE